MSSERHFIVIEGIDGSGKTTIGRKLANRLGAVFYQTPSGVWRKYRNIVEGKPPIIRCIYYLFATIASSFEISAMLRYNSVVCDRYIYSTWAYHLGYGCNCLKVVPFYRLPITKPNKTYYLQVDNSERERRIRFRNNNTYRDMDSVSLDSINNIFMSMGNLVCVDTTGLCEDDVVELLITQVKSNNNQY